LLPSPPRFRKRNRAVFEALSPTVCASNFALSSRAPRRGVRREKMAQLGILFRQYEALAVTAIKQGKTYNGATCKRLHDRLGPLFADEPFRVRNKPTFAAWAPQNRKCCRSQFISSVVLGEVFSISSMCLILLISAKRCRTSL
jgi:hypothetical protein